MGNQQLLQQAYKEALESFVERLKQDSHIVAAFVGGSLSYDEVWEKSDIDMCIVTDDEKKPFSQYHLVENGICISAMVQSRMNFKQQCEKSIQGGFFHSYLSKSKLLFCKDKAIQDLYEQILHVGERDKEIQLLIVASIATVLLEKAEKWIAVKKDAAYSFLWFLKLIEQLAQIEVLLNGGIPTREVLQQAKTFNPSFFDTYYTGLIYGPKDEQAMIDAVHAADGYLESRKDRLFKLVFDYLEAENDVRAFSETMEHMKKKYRMEDVLLVHSFEWLAQKGFIHRASSPVRLTTKSRVEVDELAYFSERGFW